MSQNIRAVAGLMSRHGRTWKVAWVGMRQHVGLIDPGEALDRRTVETHAFGEGPLQLGGRDSDRFQEAKNIGEPHADEPHIALFNRPQNELGLLVHAAQSAAQDVTAALRLAAACQASRIARLRRWPAAR